MKKTLLIPLITLSLGLGMEQVPPSSRVSYPSENKVIRIRTKSIKKKEKEVTIEKKNDFSDYFSASYLTIEGVIIVIIAIALICSPLFLYKEVPNNTLLEDSNNNECNICYETGKLTKASCGCAAMFHKKCLNDWLAEAEAETCPYCQRNIKGV